MAIWVLVVFHLHKNLMKNCQPILSIALLIVPFLYSDKTLTTVISILLGLALFILSLPRGNIMNSYGEWDKLIK